ncbi:hypothetical protein B0H10DRAFT_2005018 [Mycena sp. CBHHK59/15]|nr:hypothetical protein B0H10DRAFT_2005018 [Mycena sp. CBHHK59/15]
MELNTPTSEHLLSPQTRVLDHLRFLPFLPWRSPEVWGSNIDLQASDPFSVSQRIHRPVEERLQANSHFAFSDLPTNSQDLVGKRKRRIHNRKAVNVFSKPPVRSHSPSFAGYSTHEANLVPHPLPEEVQVLVDAYIHGAPVLCIASHARISASWGTILPDEMAFVCMGFHAVVGVQEFRAHERDPNTTPSDAAGRVMWRFKLRWGAGGEEELELPSDIQEQTTSPWWHSQLEPRDAAGLTPPSNDDISTPHYKHSRLQSPNYSFRNAPFASRCPSILPLPLVVPSQNTELGFGPEVVVEELKGWYCAECGKVNRVMMMRHRRCNSSFCSSKNPDKSRGYSVPLDAIRSPHQTLPIYLPNNTLPFGVGDPTITTWPDGMLVLRYLLGLQSNAGVAMDQQGEISAKHIFTGNAPALQGEAAELLDSIQTSCELVRDNHDSPYFSHDNGVQMQWSQPLKRAQAVLAKIVKSYICQGDEEIHFECLIVKGWVDSGSLRGTSLLDVRVCVEDFPKIYRIFKPRVGHDGYKYTLQN